MKSDIDIVKGKAEYSIKYIKQACKDSYEPFIGQIQRCYYGNAIDYKTRLNGASGGTVTALVKSYLYTSFNARALLIDGEQYQTYGNMFKLPQGSIYHLRSYEIEKPYPNKSVIVCLPCQVGYFREIMPDAIIIGLFCSHRTLLQGIRAITGNNEVQYRFKYKGNTGLKYSNRFIPLKTYWSKYLNYVYIPKSCLRCTDATSELADISIGDAHGHKEFYQGKNVIITRTDSGEMLLNNAVELGLLEVEETNPASIINSHIYIRIKKGSKELKIVIYKALRMIGYYITVWDIKPILKLWAWYIKRKSVIINE